MPETSSQSDSPRIGGRGAIFAVASQCRDHARAQRSRRAAAANCRRAGSDACAWAGDGGGPRA